MELFPGQGTSLKICGVTLRADAERLAAMGIRALGFNFWPSSKRHLDPSGNRWMADLAGSILRVGVFVNQGDELPRRLFADGMIDAVQLHGHESPAEVAVLCGEGIPVIKAVGVRDSGDLAEAAKFGADAVLLDAHAPQVFGGTGMVFDWGLAKEFRRLHPGIPLILAGGITADNAARAVAEVRPAALDVASGAESAPGVKDFTKVAALWAACNAAR